MDAHLDQSETDHRDNQTGDKRWQSKTNTPNHQPQRCVKDAADQNTAVERCQRINPLARHQRDHDGQKRKTGALHNRQGSPNRTDCQRLHQGRHPCKQHRHLDQIQQLWKIGRVRSKAKPRSARNNDCWRDV